MKRMKKLIAALMAVAMIASLNISAFAASNTGSFANTFKGGDVGDSTADKAIRTDDNTAATASATTGSPYAGERDKAYGYVTGQFSEEGKMPEGTVHMVMPTVSTTASPFNMILDPNDLIGQSTTKRIEGITSNTDYVYFTNYTDGAASGYTSTSDALTIYNKGTWPLSVKLTAELTKGDSADTGSLIQMVNSKTALSAAANKDIPSMYMAVTPSTGTAVVVADGYGKPTMTVGGTIISSKAAPTFAFAEGVLSRDKKLVNNALHEKAIRLSFNGSGNVTASIGAISNGNYTVEANGLAVTDAGTAKDASATTWNVITVVQGTTKGAMSTTSGTMSATFDIKLSRGVTASNTPTAKTVATITVALDPIAMSEGDGTTAVVGDLTFTKSTAASSATTAAIAVEAQANAYEVTYDTANTQYVKKMTDAASSQENSAWPKLSFTLSAAINKSTAWDDLNDTTTPQAAQSKAINTLQTKVIWDVANNYDADTAINAPRVKVTQYGNAAGDVVKFKLSFGKGSNAAVGLVQIKVGSANLFPSKFGLNNGTDGIATKLTPVEVTGQGATQTANASTDGTEYTFTLDAAAVTAQSATVVVLKPDMTTSETLTFTFIKSDV